MLSLVLYFPFALRCQMLSLSQYFPFAVGCQMLSLAHCFLFALECQILFLAQCFLFACRMSDAVLGTQDVKCCPWHTAFHLHIACQMLSLAHRMSDAVLDTALCCTVLIQEYNATRTWYIEAVWFSWNCL